MKKKILFFAIICLCLCSCKNIGPQNDVDIKASGQFYIEQDGQLVPFRHVLSCDIEYKMFSQVSYGMSVYSQYKHIYSDENGNFSFALSDIGGKTIHMHSAYNDADTILYSNDTTLSFTKDSNLSNINLIVSKEHTFNPIVTPNKIHYDDSCTFSINHDYLTHIELCNYHSQENYDIIWETDVNNSPTITFVIPDYLQENGLRNFHIKYTTLHYGTYLSQIYRIHIN